MRYGGTPYIYRRTSAGFTPTPAFTPSVSLKSGRRGVSQKNIGSTLGRGRGLRPQHENWCRGFTLVEMIVYIAVLVLVGVASVSAILSLDDLFARYRAEQLVFRSAHTALERLLHDIREAETVVSASSNADGSLSLSGPSGTVSYATSSDALHVSIDSVDQGALTDAGVTVTELRFYSYSGVTEFARVEMTLQSSFGSVVVEETFNAGATLRGSYGN